MPFVKGQSGNPGGRPRRKVAVLAKKARVHTAAAIRALVDALDDPRTRVQAAVALLDRGYGKAPQALEVTGADGGPIETADVTALRAGLLARVAQAVAGDATGDAGAGEPH